MNQSNFYKIVFIVVFSLLTLVRSYYKLKAGTLHDHIFNRREGTMLVLLRFVLGLPMVLACVAFFLKPNEFGWMYVTFPAPIRLFGSLLAFAAVAFIYLVHRELGVYFSTTLVIREGHRLVRTGPYRLVRHPMYSAYLCLFIGTLLFTANWLLGLSGIAIIASLMVLRIRKEEALLLERFGTEYQAYRQSTGMFIPWSHKMSGRSATKLARSESLNRTACREAALSDNSEAGR
jgi:protein-S-isoprenylcysteine O-methyltransferase Ste14